jgi:LAO/AO transport system kinase
MDPSTREMAVQLSKSSSTSAVETGKSGADKKNAFFIRRSNLSRAITLVESSAPAKQRQASLLLTYLLEQKQKRQLECPNSYHNRSAFRLGIAGAPGAGKSTFIEALGRYILSLPEESVLGNSNDGDDDEEAKEPESASSTSTGTVNEQNDGTYADDCSEILTSSNDNEQQPLWRPHQLAVLCVDPSSALAGGSILGDKTRMPELTKSPYAYIRPSPTGMGRMGGLAAYTDDVVTVCEQAGYHLVLLETVGLGQSELEVIQSVDMMVLLVPPAGGDDLQGVKKGIVEVADLLVVTKGDGNLEPAAKRTVQDYRSAMQFLRQNQHGERPEVILASSVTGLGLEQVWRSVSRHRSRLVEYESGAAGQTKRQAQSRYWMWKNLQDLVQERTRSDPVLAGKAHELQERLAQGTLTPRVAAAELLESLTQNSTSR